MTHASPYSEAAWNQWHSTRLDRLSEPDGWLSLVGLDFLTAVDEVHRLGGRW